LLPNLAMTPSDLRLTQNDIRTRCTAEQEFTLVERMPGTGKRPIDDDQFRTHKGFH
jgi:hypothetical protein